MIIVQDLDKNYLSLHTTLHGFMEMYIDKPRNKYSYLANKVAKSNGSTIKYKGFYLTKDNALKADRKKRELKKKLENNRFYNA